VSEVEKKVEFYVNATGQTVSRVDLETNVMYLIGDEVELPTIGVFRIIQRRWHVATDARVLIVQLEELV
jgi:hypothetical protein